MPLITFTVRDTANALVTNTAFTITAGFPDGGYDPEMELPAPSTHTTDMDGQFSVTLPATGGPYYLSKAGNRVTGTTAYKFFVPDVPGPLEASYLYVDLGIHQRLLNDASLLNLIETKVAVANSITALEANLTNINASVAAAIESAEVATEAAEVATLAALGVTIGTRYAATKAAALALVAGLPEGTTVIVDTDESVTPVGSRVRYTVVGGALVSPVKDQVSQAVFQAPSIGAIERSLALKTYEVLSVADFGAVLDGITDDLAACQAAIDAAVAFGRKGVYFPVGTAYLTGSLKLASGLLYFGEGWYSRIQQNTANTPVLASAGYLPAAAATVSTKSGGNVGGGSLTIDPVAPVTTSSVNGTYLVRCTVASPGGGTFQVTSPTGSVLGTVAVGGTFTSHIKFTIATSGTDFAVGDGFDVSLAGAPSGRTFIRDLYILGGASAGSNNHGILLRDYYSSISNVLTSSTGGDGIRMWDRNIHGTRVSSTLVENRLDNVTVSSPTGYGIYIGEDDNNKITDGFIQNCIIRSTATTPNHLRIGSAAGWQIDGVHTYGTSGPTSHSFNILNAYHTMISNVYIENFGSHGIYAARTQRALSFSNIHVKNSVAGASAIRIDKSSAVSACEVTIDGLHVVNSGSSAVVGVSTVNSAVTVRVGSNCSFVNTSTGSITKFSPSGAGLITFVGNAVVDGKLRETTNKRTLMYQDMALAQASASGFSASNPAVSISRNFALSGIGNYQSLMGTVFINSREFYNQTVRVKYMGMVYVQAKVNGTDVWKVSLTDVIAPVGFSANPTVSITDNGDGTGTLTITFTPADTDGYGAVKIIWAPAEDN